VLRFSVIDTTDLWHKDPSSRSGEFALYDKYDPQRKIELVLGTGAAYKGTGVRGDFLLNFNAYYGKNPAAGALPAGAEGVFRASGVTPDGVPYSATYDRRARPPVRRSGQ
jgi:hypothetical protein